jgi:hypothetical protein
MTHIANFVKTVQERAALNQLIDQGEIGRCVECDELTPDKDDDEEWYCGCINETDDAHYNNSGRV